MEQKRKVRVSSRISKFENCAVPNEAYIPLVIMVKNRIKIFFPLMRIVIQMITTLLG